MLGFYLYFAPSSFNFLCTLDIISCMVLCSALHKLFVSFETNYPNHHEKFIDCNTAMHIYNSNPSRILDAHAPVIKFFSAQEGLVV